MKSLLRICNLKNKNYLNHKTRAKFHDIQSEIHQIFNVTSIENIWHDENTSVILKKKKSLEAHNCSHKKHHFSDVLPLNFWHWFLNGIELHATRLYTNSPGHSLNSRQCFYANSILLSEWESGHYTELRDLNLESIDKNMFKFISKIF